MSQVVKLGKLKLKNPVCAASGTFTLQIAQKYHYEKLGALFPKTVTLKPKAGNPLPHIIKTEHGFLNSVGLKNPGIDAFIKNDLPEWLKLKTAISVSIGGETEKEYIKLAQKLDKIPQIAGIEVNISCPNLDRGGMSFGQNPKIAYRLIKSIRRNTKHFLITKLTPNVTDISEIAEAAANAGSDALSLINTVLATKINPKTGKSYLARVVGGLSGICIKPIAQAAVWKVKNVIKIPIIGMGGITTPQDALEFLALGADAVAVGSAIYQDPRIPLKILSEIKNYS